MIKYRLKYFKDIIYTIKKDNLYFVGNYNFYVRDKFIRILGDTKPSEPHSRNFYILAATSDGKFEEIFKVSREEYAQISVGDLFGECGVIKHKYKDDFSIATRSTGELGAIGEATKHSLMKFIALIIVYGATIAFIIYFFKPLWDFAQLGK